ncbi:MAG: hypothetical protein ACOZF0_08270 [Thermodesulfobacteriota bacterium]
MHPINLNDGTIEYEGRWLTIHDLTAAIQKKIESGDMKFAELAAALEELNKAIENSRTISVKLILEKTEYEALREKGQADDRECILKAIKAFIGKEPAAVKESFAETIAYMPPPKKIKKKGKIKCAGCGKPIEVSLDEEESEIHCSHCGARGLLKPRQME